MLKVVEYGIFAVSLLAVLGLIIGMRRSRPAGGQPTTALSPAAEPSDSGTAPLSSTKQR